MEIVKRSILTQNKAMDVSLSNENSKKWARIAGDVNSMVQSVLRLGDETVPNPTHGSQSDSGIAL